MQAIRFNLPAIPNPSRKPKRRGKRGRKRNPSGTSEYLEAAGHVFLPPMAYTAAGALIGTLIGAVARPEKLSHSAFIGGALGLIASGLVAADHRI